MKKPIALVFLLALAACAGDSSPDKPADSAKADKKATQKSTEDATKDLICPQVAILQAGEDIFDFGGEKPDPSQLVAKAHMKSIEGDCGYTKNGVDITFALHMVARRGPRLGGEQVSFPYFIALIDPADHIISRQIVTAQFHFSGLDKTAADDEPLHVFIPITEQALPAGPAYRVLVGFQEPKPAR